MLLPIARRAREVSDPESTPREVLRSQSGRAPGPPRWGVRGCRVRPREGHPFPVFEVVPDGSSPTRTVLHLHGGGFVGDIDGGHWRYAGAVARAAGARVVLPAYPLAPTHSWRDSSDALFGLWQELAVEAPAGVALLGDSAGGGLALRLAQRAAAGSGPQPTHLVLVSPWVDLTGDTPGTEQARSRDPWLKLTKLRLYGRWWAGDDDPALPQVSPLFGELAGLPPTLVQCGTRDLLLPQVRELVRRSRAAGVEVTYVEEPGLLHVYPLLPVPEAGRARRQLLDFVGSSP